MKKCQICKEREAWVKIKYLAPESSKTSFMICKTCFFKYGEEVKRADSMLIEDLNQGCEKK